MLTHETNGRQVKAAVKVSLWAAAAVAMIGLVLPATPAVASGNPNPGVAPPQSMPYGRSYSEWTAAWWHFMLTFPIHDPPYTGSVYNPLFDQTGSDCAVGQSGHVWYLAGVFAISGTEVRTCSTPVPAGRSIFLPVINAFNSDAPACGATATIPELRQGIGPEITGATNLHATVDGRALQDLKDYRFKSPVFYFDLPAQDNVFQFLGCNVSGRQGPAVSDGYWIMLRPLPPGPHTIEFGGTIPANNNFITDVTYQLTVA